MTEEKQAAEVSLGGADPLSEQVKLLIAALAGAGAILGSTLNYMQRVEDWKKQREDARIREIDDEIFVRYHMTALSSLLTPVPAAETHLPGVAEQISDVARVYAEEGLKVAQARRSPHFRKEQARTLFARMTSEEILSLLSEEHVDVRNLFAAIAAEAVDDPKPDSPMGTFHRILRERNEAFRLLRQWQETPFFELQSAWKQWKDAIMTRVEALLTRK